MSVFSTIFRCRPARLLINPRFESILREVSLADANDFMSVEAVIVGGHRNRHVAHCCLKGAVATIGVYLKREQRVLWRDYAMSLHAGFGWVSRSVRETLMLQSLRDAGVDCPEWIAAGEDGRGAAFLIVRELSSVMELRSYLRDASARERSVLAGRLGETIARIHARGFYHGDLHSKHIMIEPQAGRICLLDWQRSWRVDSLTITQRSNDLSMLQATLADDLACDSVRRQFLRSYLLAAGIARTANERRALIRSVAARVQVLLGKRYIQEVRQPPLPAGSQNLIRLDGESVCVTRAFRTALNGNAPSWLKPDRRTSKGNSLTRSEVAMPGTGRAKLVYRRASRPIAWLWTRLQGHAFPAPEMQQAAILFRLERYGIKTPQLLAVGQEYTRPWQTNSFLLTASPEGATDLADWLSGQSTNAAHAGVLLRLTGRLLRRLHDARCYLLEAAPLSFSVRQNDVGDFELELCDTSSLTVRRKPSQRRAHIDIRRVVDAYAVRRTDQMRVLVGYLGLSRSKAAVRRMYRRLALGAANIPKSFSAR